MVESFTKMRQEIEQIPDAIQRLLDHAEPSIGAIAGKLKEVDPRLICTVARGSSDHAAHFLKYAFELTVRVPVASIGPSVNSVYGVDLLLDKSACFAISQSGKSPDIVSMTRSASNSGAYTCALTNSRASALAAVSTHAFDIQAGAEQSVAATKTFINSIVSGLLVLAHWQGDQELMAVLRGLPALSEKAIARDWSPLLNRLVDVESVFVLGRGPTFAIANEVALKFKETSQIHAESYSFAEVLHGPVSMVKDGFPVLSLVSKDAAEQSSSVVAGRLASMGGEVYTTGVASSGLKKLPAVSSGHPLCDPILLAISFYAQLEKLARLRGRNPDKPQNLKKVTETV